MAQPREKMSKRQKVCFGFSLFFIFFGVFHIVFGFLRATRGRVQACPTGSGILTGAYLFVAGILGSVGYFPRKTRNSYKQIAAPKMSRGLRSLIAVFVLLCGVSAALVFTVTDSVDCIITREIKQTVQEPFFHFATIHAVALYAAHLMAAICVGLAIPDVFLLSASGVSTRSEKSPARDVKCKSSKQALHLPEARTHVQEDPGTGDRVTVVSLPETDGIVYAVPEDQYVIRRGEATYMAPTGNTKLTAFFPTYTKVPVD